MKEKVFDKATLVCVTDQSRCENLIIAGRKISDITKTNLYVINANNYTQYGRNQDPAALEHLFRISQENGAEMNVIYNEDFLKVMKESINKHNAINVITGVPQKKDSVLNKLWKEIGWVNYYMVNEKGVSVKVGSSVETASNKK